jgi:hypothetical protein
MPIHILMKKCFLLSILAFITAGSHLFAAAVTVTDARQVASNFYKLNMQGSAPSANLVYTKMSDNSEPLFYVFDMSPATGFVIVAANDVVRPILGYSTESNFRTDFQHIGLNHWMYKTATNIQLALRANVQASARIAGQWSAYRQRVNPVPQRASAVAPLVTTSWDQENEGNPPPYLYNLLCPWNSTDHQRAVTGCVATAQAQVMKFWNYPAYGLDSFSYDDATALGYTGNYGVLSSNFANHVYQWQLMPTMLTGTQSASEDSSIDVLMYDCGVSVGMDYGDDNQDGSGANALLAEELPYDSFCTQYALVKYFSYNKDTIKGYFEDHFTAAEWIALIEHDLNIGRPVMYEGNDTTQGGHCWVCDGYDADTMLHMNWGWSGFEDGYFAINNLTTAGNFNPVLEDDALVGIIPKYTTPPSAKFAASFAGVCNEVVHFTDSSQGTAMRWDWNFGDGTSSKLQNPTHTYTDSGTYTVTLTAGNPAGFSTKTAANYVTVTCISAGIEALGNVISFNMFPNPATTDVVLQTTETGGDATWYLKNMLGQTLISKNVEAAQTHVNLNNLSGGIYLVELKVGERTAVKKLVINR